MYSIGWVGNQSACILAIPLGILILSCMQDNVKEYNLLTRQKACNQDGIYIPGKKPSNVTLLSCRSLEKVEQK